MAYSLKEGKRMRKTTILGFLLLFLKINLTINDMGYFYLISNLLGISIILFNIKNNRAIKDDIYMKFYIILNIILLALKLTGLEITSIALTDFSSFLLSIFFLLGLFINFFYPLILFSSILNKAANGIFSYQKVAIFVKIALLLIPLLTISFMFSPFLSSILIFIIIILEITSAYLLLSERNSDNKIFNNK